MPLAALSVVFVDRRPQYVVHKCWGLAEHEYEDDHHKNQRDILLISISSSLAHRLSLFLSLLQSLDELVVQVAQGQEGSTMHDQEIQHVGVQDTVEHVLSEGTRVKNLLGGVGTHTDDRFLILEEAWYVVNNGEYRDQRNMSCGRGTGTKVLRLEGLAHSEVPVG